MGILANIIFALLLGAAAFLFYRSVRGIRRNIRLGRSNPRTDQPRVRLRNMLRVAIGQQKMGVRPIPAILHTLIYVGFLVVNLEVLEIVLDGLLGTHRVLGQLGGPVYDAVIFMAEVFMGLVLLAAVGFLLRRGVARVPRFQGVEMRGWNHLDARIILWTEIVLVMALITMNASDVVLQQRGEPHYHQAGLFPVSGLFTGLFAALPSETLVVLERTGWWLHIAGILAFLNYIPYSKHLHIFLAFPNVYYSNTGVRPLGQVNHIEAVRKEVETMLTGDPYATPAPEATPAVPQKFGAKDIFDLERADLISAYTCTECGRCTSVCPANVTGKLLSPRKIMMDTRDRMEHVGKALDKQGTWQDDGKALLGDYITPEEIWACTTCNACAQACPVNINPVSIILQLRQYQILEQSAGPELLNGMFNNLQNTGGPWAFAAADRFNWANGIETAPSAHA